jgi:hypothetical protein
MTTNAASKATKTYAGLDVSLKETAICIVDDGGKIVIECMVPTDATVIATYHLAKHGPARWVCQSAAWTADMRTVCCQ